MNSFQKSLDRYLTSEPDDDFTPYCEKIGELLGNEWWDNNEDWFIDSKQANKWLNMLFDKDKEVELAAKIIERSFNIYIKFE